MFDDRNNNDTIARPSECIGHDNESPGQRESVRKRQKTASEWGVSMDDCDFETDDEPTDNDFDCQQIEEQIENSSSTEERDESGPSVEKLVTKVFATYKPRFFLAQREACPGPTEGLLEPTHPNGLFMALVEPTALSFLAPHDILSFWSSSKAIRESTRNQRRYILMESVFNYFRISEEAARHVLRLQGGWRTFLPVLVSLSEHLSRKVYGHLEPDLAHRVCLAEQACFGRSSEWNSRSGMGALAHRPRQKQGFYSYKLNSSLDYSDGSEEDELGGNCDESEKEDDKDEGTYVFVENETIPIERSALLNGPMRRNCWNQDRLWSSDFRDALVPLDSVETLLRVGDGEVTPGLPDLVTAGYVAGSEPDFMERNRAWMQANHASKSCNTIVGSERSSPPSTG